MSRSAVLDASALVEFLLDAESVPAVAEVLADQACHVALPHLCDLEVVSALRTLLKQGVIVPARAEEILALYESLMVDRIHHLPLLRRILSLRDNISAYDAAYVALAEALEAPLYTSDGRLARAVATWTDVQMVEV